MLHRGHCSTPLGWVEMEASDNGLRCVRALDTQPLACQQSSHRLLTECARQLHEYFAGERRTFDLPLDAAGTPWQHNVWTALGEIPYGATATYGQLARRLGAPNASRAVGAANGRNPIWVIVPCHRVIGASGTLTGYAGGLSRKQQLLDLEQKFSGQSLFASTVEIDRTLVPNPAISGNSLAQSLRR